MHQVGFGRKQEVFSMKEIHAEPPFPCDYVRNGYCKCIITSTAESKHVFFVCFFKSQIAHWKWRLTSNVVSALNWSGIYIYIYNSLNTLSGGKSCLVAPGVAVLPWATKTVLSPLVGSWWGHGITRAFTRCMMKKKKLVFLESRPSPLQQLAKHLSTMFSTNLARVGLRMCRAQLGTNILQCIVVCTWWAESRLPSRMGSP